MELELAKLKQVFEQVDSEVALLNRVEESLSWIADNDLPFPRSEIMKWDYAQRVRLTVTRQKAVSDFLKTAMTGALVDTLMEGK
jgi:Cu/Ag efflux pump CusA